jgi:HEAT repeat protein/beta-lactamase regulating signal transducer with metallopeptidase domain
MNAVEAMLGQPVIEALGWALLHFIWQGMLVAILLSAVISLLDRRRAEMRYLAACAAMLLMLVLPVATTAIITASDSGEPARVSESSANKLTTATPRAVDRPSTAQTSIGLREQIAWRLATWLPWLMSGWMVGVLILSLRLFGGCVAVRRLRRRGARAISGQWQQTLRHLCARFRVTRPVRLIESTIVQVPTAIGWLRPVILMPASAVVSLTVRQLEALLAHELAHIRRHDYLINLFQRIIETMLFYHPAVWWVSRQVRIEREHCCDDMAVAVCGDALVYARALAEIEVMRVARMEFAVAANGGLLINRIRRLTGLPDPHSNRIAGLVAGLIAFSTVGIVVATAGSPLLAHLTGNSPLSREQVTAIQQLAAEQRQGDDKSQQRDGAAQALNVLLITLKGRNWEVRGDVAEALQQIKRSGTIEPLVAALQDSNWRSREKVAWAMGMVGDRRGVDPLIVVLQDASSEVSHTAAWALAMIGDRRAVEPLIANLKTSEAEARQGAAWALGKLRDRSSVEPLILLLKDESSDVRHAAAWSLGEIGDRRAVEPLTAALEDRDEDVRAVAAKSLSLINRHSDNENNGDDYSKNQALTENLKKTQENARAQLVPSVDDTEVKPLLDALEDEDVYVRDEAITALGRLGDKRAVEPLIVLLRDQNVYIRDNAITALGQIGDRRAVEPLIATLQDRNVYIRDNAITALGGLRDPRAVAPLVALLKDGNVYIRDNAAEALGRIGDARAVEPLKEALSDENWYVRETVAKSLARLSRN